MWNLDSNFHWYQLISLDDSKSPVAKDDYSINSNWGKHIFKNVLQSFVVVLGDWLLQCSLSFQYDFPRYRNVILRNMGKYNTQIEDKPQINKSQQNCGAPIHYCGVIMGSMASQITGVSIVCSTVGSGTDQRKHQSFASLAFVRGVRRWTMNSPHKEPVTRIMCPFKCGKNNWLLLSQCVITGIFAYLPASSNCLY